MSNLGFRTRKEAILALDDDGVAPKDIAERLDCPINQVRARIAERRKAVLTSPGWSVEIEEKARRIHKAALEVIADALRVSVTELRGMLGLMVKAEPAPDLDLQVTPVPAALEATSLVAAPKPAVAAKQAARTYGLRAVDGQWLTRDGQSFTNDVGKAWTGNGAELKAVRTRFGNAKFCKSAEIGEARS